MPNAIVRVRCTDRKGIIAGFSDFVFRHGGNIVDLDQHTDRENGRFAMRLEWDLADFTLDRDGIRMGIEVLARSYSLEATLDFTDCRDRVAVFCGKEPHCLDDLLLRQRLGELPGDIVVVVSNHDVLRPIAEHNGLPFVHLPVPTDPVGKAHAETAQRQLLAERRIDLVVLAKYMQVLSSDFVRAWAGKVINIHHSFLPAFPGKAPYRQAKARGVKLIGATAHYATEVLDEGPIIAQDVVRVSHRDTVADLVRQGRDVERNALGRAVRLHLARRVLIEGNATVVFS